MKRSEKSRLFPFQQWSQVNRGNSFRKTIPLFGLALKNLSPGSHELTCRAYDTFGNSAISLPIVIGIDNESPSLPSGVGITATHQTLALSWSPSTDTGDGGGGGITVDPSTDMGFASFVPGWKNQDVGLTVSTTTMVLMVDTPCFASGRAVYVVGNVSSNSNVVSVQVGPFTDHFDTETPCHLPLRWTASMVDQANGAISGDVFAGAEGNGISLVDENSNGMCQMQYPTGQKGTGFYYRANYRFRETKSSHYALLGNGNVSNLYFRCRKSHRQRDLSGQFAKRVES